MQIVMKKAPEGMVLELTYQGYVVGWVRAAGQFEAADNDDLYINAAIVSRLAA